MYRYIESKDDLLMEIVKFSDCFKLSEISKQAPYAKITTSLQYGLINGFNNGDYGYSLLDSAMIYLRKIDEASIFIDNQGDFFRSSYYHYLSYLLNLDISHLKWLSEEEEEDDEDDDDYWDDEDEDEDEDD